MNSDCKLKISKLLKPNELLEKIANLSQRKWTWIEIDYRHFQLLSRILIKYFPQSVQLQFRTYMLVKLNVKIFTSCNSKLKTKI